MLGTTTVTVTQLVSGIITGGIGANNTATITVSTPPSTPTISAGGPTTFCAGGSVTLTSSSATGNQWFLGGVAIGGATGQTYSANASGSYTVVVTTCSSVSSAATNVTVNALPTITPGTISSICSGFYVVYDTIYHYQAANSIQYFRNRNYNSNQRHARNSPITVNLTSGASGSIPFTLTVKNAQPVLQQM